MGRLTKAGSDLARRNRYAAHLRRLCNLPMPGGRRAADVPGCPWPAQLRRLEAGESVLVQGWEVGIARDDGASYVMDDAGRLTRFTPGAR